MRPGELLWYPSIPRERAKDCYGGESRSRKPYVSTRNGSSCRSLSVLRPTSSGAMKDAQEAGEHPQGFRSLGLHAISDWIHFQGNRDVRLGIPATVYPVSSTSGGGSACMGVIEWDFHSHFILQVKLSPTLRRANVIVPCSREKAMLPCSPALLLDTLLRGDGR